MESFIESIWESFIGILVLIIITYVLYHLAVGDQHTIFYNKCAMVDGECQQGSVKVYGRITYRVHPENSTVVSWGGGGFANMPPELLVDCAIRDKLNWNCKQPDGADSQVMLDGNTSYVDTLYALPTNVFKDRSTPSFIADAFGWFGLSP